MDGMVGTRGMYGMVSARALALAYLGRCYCAAVRDLLSGKQKVSDPGRRMEGLGKDKGRPKDRARAPNKAR